MIGKMELYPKYKHYSSKEITVLTWWAVIELSRDEERAKEVFSQLLFLPRECGWGAGKKEVKP
jgi:hypothetical protein